MIGYSRDDVTLSVPKLYFGYATGSNLLFPFAAGGASALFPEPVTAEVVFERIRRFRPTVLINVPTMINKMVSHPDASAQDLSSLRVCTSAGEALPVELHERWRETFGVELLDGLGTAEMWHIFISNRPGAARPGTLGTVVPGFEVKVCDDDGRELPPGETGWLWVRGGSRAIAYWQQHGEDPARLPRRVVRLGRPDPHATPTATSPTAAAATSCSRSPGKWLAPAEVEGCLLQHPAVARGGGGRRRGRERAGQAARLRGRHASAATGSTRSSRRSCATGSSPTSTRARWCSSTRCHARIWARSIAAGCSVFAIASRPARVCA